MPTSIFWTSAAWLVGGVLAAWVLSCAINALLLLAVVHSPVKSCGLDPAPSLESLNARFEPLDSRLGFYCFACAMFIGFTTWRALVGLSRLSLSLEGPADMALMPQAAIWWILPLFLGIGLCWQMVLFLWSLFGEKADVDLYEHRSSMTIGFDGTRFLQILAAFMCTPVAVLTVLALPQHTVLQTDAIRARGYALGRLQTYPYSEARRLTVIDGYRLRNGTIEKRPSIVLDFTDGRRWSSRDLGEIRSDLDPALLAYLQAKTRLRAQHAQTESDIH